MDNIRLKLEDLEYSVLSPYGAKSRETKGRTNPEEKCELRTDYQRDRDRIIHSKAFRLLKHKTQVFISPKSDHYRTRLTHTLEVSQIARTIAKALMVNEDLTEAIALGHDLGHTPFGHAGERALNELNPQGFTHFEQSVRVCEKLEKDGEGLNLTYEVLDGIRHHARGELPETCEGRIVRLSDRIAYINHDIDDAITAGIISESDIPKEITDYLGDKKSLRIDSLVKSIVETSNGFDIKMDGKTEKYCDRLHEFVIENVYHSDYASNEDGKVFGIVEGLYGYYKENVSNLPKEFIEIAKKESVERAVTDYIATMTDHIAIENYKDICVPKFWTI